MEKIFVSYRRQDAYPARLIGEKLSARFGIEAVFLDSDTIPPGADFAARIDEALRQCKVFLAVIGEHWLGAQPDGTRRIDAPRDWVKYEVEAALGRDILLIPVLVGGASLPKAAELPESLQPLRARNATEVTPGAGFSAELDRLTQAIEDHLGQRTFSILKRYGDQIAALPRPIREIAHVFARRHLGELVQSLGDLSRDGVYISMDESAELTRTLLAAHLRYLSIERAAFDPNVHWSSGYRKLWEAEAARTFEYVLLADPAEVRRQNAAAGVTRVEETRTFKMLAFMRARGAGCYFCDVASVVDERAEAPPFREFAEIFDDRVALLMDPLDDGKARGAGRGKPGFVAKQLKVTAVVLHEGHDLLQIANIVRAHRVEITPELIARQLLGP
jgi:hypothetical protein